jgi:MSHA biogenesis protein MshJ
MNASWRKYADRIDALSVRERAMVFITALVFVLFLINALFIDPLMTRNKALSAQMAQQQTELLALQVKIQALEKDLTEPDIANRARRDGIKREIAQIDATLKDMQQSLVPAQNMQALLQEMLTRNPRLQLIAMRTLPAAPLVAKRDTTGRNDDTAPGAKAAAGADGVFKHGVRITVQGSYADLHDYLARLEKLSWQMFWSRASLNADDYPRLTLTLTIYTLSLDKAWLVV